MGNDLSNPEDVGIFDELDELLVSANDDLFEDGFINRYSKKDRRRKGYKFDITNEPIGSMFSNGGISRKVIQSLMHDVSLLADNRKINQYTYDISKHFYVIQLVHSAIRREILRDRIRTSQSASALHDRLKLSAPPLSTTAKIGIKTAVRMFLILIKSAEKYDKEIIGDILDLMNDILQECPLLSLVEGPAFSPDITNGIRPFLLFIESLVTSAYSEIYVRQKAISILFGIALARGSLLELLSLVKILLLLDANGLNDLTLPVLGFVKCLVEYRIDGDDSDTKKIDRPEEFADSDEKMRQEERRHSLARIGSDVFVVKKQSSLIQMDFISLDNAIFPPGLDRYDSMDDKEKEQFELSVFPYKSDLAMKHFIPSIDRLNGDDDELSMINVCLVVLAQLDRLSSFYCRKADDDVWNDDPNRLAMLNNPLAIEVKPETIILLSETLEILSPGYFSSHGCHDSSFLKNMYMLVAVLRVLRCHLYQLVRAKLPKSEFSIERRYLEKLRSQVFKFIEIKCSQRFGILIVSSSVVSSIIQQEAAQTLAESFEFFYPSIFEQLSYLVELIKFYNFDSNGKGTPQYDILELLLSRFSSFNSGTLLMDELEDSEDGLHLKNVLRDVLMMLLDAAYWECEAALHGKQCFSSNVLGVLLNFQRHLLSRASTFGSRLRQDGVDETEIRRLKGAKTIVLDLVQIYVLKLLELSVKLLDTTSSLLGQDCTSEALRRIGEDVLLESLISKLLRVLVSSLTFYCTPEYMDLCRRVFPVLTELLICSDRLCAFVSTSFPSDELISVDKKRVVQSKHPFRNNVDKEDIITIKNAKSLTIVFDKAKCSTSSKNNFVQLFKKPNKEDQITDKFWGTYWPQEPIVIDGDTVSIYFHSDDIGAGWGYRIIILGTVVVRPLEWLEKFVKLAAWVLGRQSAVMLSGPDVDRPEREVVAKWGVLLRGSVESWHPLSLQSERDQKEDVVSAVCQDEFLKLRSQMQGVKDERVFLDEICQGVGDGSVLIQTLEEIFPDRHIVQPSIMDAAKVVVRAGLGLLLKHCGKLSQALNIAKHGKTMVDEEVIKVWKKALEMKVELRALKAQGIETNVLLHNVMTRIQFLYDIKRYDQGTPNDAMMSPRNQDLVSPHSPDFGFFQGKPQRKVSTVTKVLKNTMKALKRLKELMIVRTRMVSIQQDPESQLLAGIMSFVFDGNLSIQGLLDVIGKQRQRAVVRNVAISSYLYLLPRISKNLVPELLRHLSVSFRKVFSEGLVAFTTLDESLRIESETDILDFSKHHFLSNLSCAGVDLRKLVSSSFFMLIKNLMSLELDDASRLILLDLLNIDYHSQDFAELEEVGIVDFISPLVSFPFTNPGILSVKGIQDDLRMQGSLMREPWNIRFSAWNLMRILAYSSTSVSGSYDIQESLLEMMFHHMFSLGKMREFEIRCRIINANNNRHPKDSELEELLGDLRINTKRTWSCYHCSFWNVFANTSCIVCSLSQGDSEELFRKQRLSTENEGKGLEFAYETDFDNKGVLYYLGTNGYTESWKNPHDRGAVKCSASSMQNDSDPVSSIVGLSCVRCVTQAKPNQCFKIVFIDHVVCPTHYSLKHYSSWDTEALRSWKFEASKDGINWICLKEHINDGALDRKGATHTWEIIPKPVDSFSQFRIFMTDVNSNNHWYCAVSGFEIYGILDGDVENGSGSKTKVSNVDYFDVQETVDLEFGGDNPAKPNSVVHVNFSETWHTCKGVKEYSSGKHLLEFRIDHDGGGTNTWKFIVGVVPASFQINGLSTWVGAQGGWGYIGGLGHKNNNSSTNSPYGETYTAGDIIGVALNFEMKTIEFLKNGKSFGVAFENLEAPVFAAVSITGPRSKVCFLQHCADEEQLPKVEARSWKARLDSCHLSEAAIAWHKHNLEDVGIRGRPTYQSDFPSVAEMDSFINQFLWIILRCSKSLYVQKILSTRKWLRLILDVLESGSFMAQLLVLRICRFLLPGISPNDDRLSLSGWQDAVLRVLGNASLACLDWVQGDGLQVDTEQMDISDNVPRSSDIEDTITLKIVQGVGSIEKKTLTAVSQFVSCVGSLGISKGKWYYEVSLETGGLQQIGWVTSKFEPHSDSDGVGDDLNSWAYDGHRGLKWHSGSQSYGARWSVGDIVGCALDLDERTMRFYLNGLDMGLAFADVDCSSSIFPGVSLLAGESCKFAFAEAEFKFPKPVNFCAIVDNAQDLTPSRELSIGADAVASEYVSLGRILMRSSLWKSPVSEQISEHIQLIPIVVQSLNQLSKYIFSSKMKPSMFDWNADYVPSGLRSDLKKVFAALSILGGNIEPLREGCRVRLDTALQSIEGTVSRITKESPKSTLYTVNLDAGDEVVVNDPGELTALPPIDVPLKNIKSADILLRILAEFLKSDAPVDLVNNHMTKHMFFMLQRVSLRVVLALLQKEEVISLILNSNFSETLGKKAVSSCEVLMDRCAYTVHNLECRVLALHRKLAEVRDPSCVELNDPHEMELFGQAVHSKSLGADWVVDGVEFDDFDFLVSMKFDTGCRVQEIIVRSNSKVIQGFEVLYIVREEIYSAGSHFGIDYGVVDDRFEDHKILVKADEYLKCIEFSYDIGLNAIIYLCLKTSSDAIYKFGNVDIDPENCLKLEAPLGRGIIALFGSTGKYLQSLGIVHQDVYTKRIKNFVYERDFDENGIIFFLGTSMGLDSWKNPMDLGHVVVTVARPKVDSKPPSAVVGRDVVRCLCHDMLEGWFCIDFKKNRVRPSYYSLRHYDCWDTEALRHWNLEASNDGANWVILRRHVNDESIKRKGQVCSWPVDCADFYCKFRILMTGPNSNDHNYLVLSGFEVYGELVIFNPEKKPTRSFEPISQEAPVGLTATEQSSGFIYSCGHGGSGRLGLGSSADVSIPAQLPKFSAKLIVEVSAFNQHVLALTEDGKVYSWGNGSDGRLGHGNSVVLTSPRLISVLENVPVVQVCAGNSFSAVLDCNGKVWTFGKGNEGQLGNGSTIESKLPVVVGGHLENVEIGVMGVGAFHVLAVSRSGDLYSWGRNLRGQLGLGSSAKKKLVPQRVLFAPVFVDVCGGWDHSLGLAANSMVYSWGNGYEGSRPATGLGTSENILVPTLVGALADKDIVKIGCGWDHSMALTGSGNLYVWGSNTNGILGDGTTTNSNVPVFLDSSLFGNDPIVYVDGGQNHTACLTERGEVWTWGSFLGVENLRPKIFAESVDGCVFQSVVCGDKATFLLSSELSNSLASVAPSNNTTRADACLPPYPRHAYLVGYPGDFFVGYDAIPKPNTLDHFKDPVPLSVEFVSCDGGFVSNADHPANVLIDDESTYCSLSSSNINFICRIVMDPDEICQVKTVVVRTADPFRFTAPLKHALVFILDNISESTIAQTAHFNSFTKEQYLSYLVGQRFEQGRLLSEFTFIQPVAFIDMSQALQSTFECMPGSSGKYILVKFIRSSQEPVISNVDVQYIGFTGFVERLGNDSQITPQVLSDLDAKVVRNFCGEGHGSFAGPVGVCIDEATVRVSNGCSFSFPVSYDRSLTPVGMSVSVRIAGKALQGGDEKSVDIGVINLFSSFNPCHGICVSMSGDVSRVQLNVCENELAHAFICRDDESLTNWLVLTLVLDFGTSDVIGAVVYIGSSPEIAIQIPAGILDANCLDKAQILESFCGNYKHVGFWSYALSHEQVLSTAQSGLDYVAADYLVDQKHDNSIYSYSFDDQQDVRRLSFANEVLVFPATDAKLSSSLYVHLGAKPAGYSFDRRVGSFDSLQTFSILIDLRIPSGSFRSAVTIFPSLRRDLPVVSVDSSGRICVFGTSNKRYKRFSPDTWHRLIISSESARHQIFVFIDGQIAALFTDDSLTNSCILKSDATLFANDDPQTAVHLLRVQFRVECISQNSAMKLGGPSEIYDDQLDLNAVSQSLVQMGHPISWSKKALIQCKYVRYLAHEWILKNVHLLQAEDKQEEHRKNSTMLSLMGYSVQLCTEALCACDDDIGKAILYLLERSHGVSSGADMTRRSMNIEKGPANNGAFRILANTSEPMDVHIGLGFQRVRPVRVQNFSDIDEFSLTDIQIAQELTEEALLTTYARSCVLEILRSWPASVEPSLTFFGSDRFLVKFIRLIEFSQTEHGLEILGGFLKRMLLREEIEISKKAQRELKDCAPVARMLLGEALTQMIGLIYDPVKKISSESEALHFSSPCIILWILDLFANLVPQQSSFDHRSISHLFFCKAVVNLVFEVIVVSSGEQRLSFVRLLSHLVRLGVEFDSSKVQIFKDLMNQMHVAQSPAGVYSSFFQAFVELNIGLERIDIQKCMDIDVEEKEEMNTKEQLPMELEEDLKDSSNGIQFIYSEDFDANGIMYYLGSQNSSVFSNPAELGVVKVVSSSLMNDSCPVSVVVGRDAVRCVSQPIPNQWFMVDLLEHSLLPTHYTLRHYISWDTEALRNWKLEGSNDDITWITLREHVNDTALCKKGQSFTWELFDIEESYSKFRIYMTGLNSNQHWYMALSGFEIYGMLDADSLSWEEERVELVYDCDGDEKGICSYIGTNRNMEIWSNPAESHQIRVEASSLQHNSDPVTAIVGREVVRCVTLPNPNQWFLIDFMDRRIVPRMYSLRHYASYDTEALRNWNLEASNDGTNWICLRTHKDDSSLEKKGQFASWEISNVNESFSQFRVIMTGKNSNDHWYLALSGFEIYGTLLLKTGQKTKKPSEIARNKPWFENILAVDSLIKSFVDYSIGLPEEFVKKLVKASSLWSSEKEYFKSHNIDPFQDFHEVNSLFNPDADDQIIQLTNRFAEKNGTNPRKMKANQWFPLKDELIHFDKIEHMPLRALQLRFFVLQQMNSKIGTILPYVDFSLPLGYSSLADGLKSVRNLISFSTKESLWGKALDSTVSNPVDLEVVLDRFRASNVKERGKQDSKARKTLFGQAFQQLTNRDPAMFRLEKGKCAWKTVFRGENSDDYGGPYRNSLEDICSELQSSILPLFIRCPNGRENIGNNRDKYVPRPSSKGPHFLRMYEFVGKLMGLAIRTKNILNLDFPSIVYKALVGERITAEDVLNIDLLSFKLVDEMEKFEHSNESEVMFEEYVNSKFVVVASDQRIYPLIPGGEDIPVTWDNRHEFIKALVSYRMNEFQVQCDAIKRGLATVIPYPLLPLFTWQELELLVCGRPKMNVELLEKMSVYDGCSRRDPHIQLFWRMMHERLDDEEKCQFLRFVWGRSRLPLSAEEFERKFKISRMPKSESSPDDYLPISHTCFFSLDLPKYSTLDILHHKILYAITHCVAIDADDTTNAHRAARRGADVEDVDSSEEDGNDN